MFTSDFNGREFHSIKEMCKAHGINISTYRARRYKGMTMQQALVVPVMKTNGIYCRDHQGHSYACFSDMAKRWGVLPTTLFSRLNFGYSIEQALVQPVRRFKK